LWGYKLRANRFGRDTDRLVAQALEREHWSEGEWKEWQGRRLQSVLDRASRTVPFYRNQWVTRDEANSDDLQSWPILEKEPLRADPHSFLSNDCDPARMIHEHTSGTTGKAIELWYSRETARSWYALIEARWRGWYGVSRQDRWAHIGGQLVTPVHQRNPPFWVWNAALNQLYMSAYHLAPDLIPHYLDALRKHRITYLCGYTSALYSLARVAVDSGVHDLAMKVAVTDAEPLDAYQRDAISQAFQCPVRETYGMSEMVAAASECEHGRMHLWPEAGIMELVEEDRVVPAGGVGEVVCTGLLNSDMPLIRYRLGDRAALAPKHTVCPCGRRLPILSCIEGRTDDVLFTRDGRQIGRLDPVFKANLPVREAQIIQESLLEIRVIYSPAPGFSESDAQSIIDRLHTRMGDVRVILEPVDEIPRSANGKFRAVMCRIPPSERAQIGIH